MAEFQTESYAALHAAHRVRVYRVVLQIVLVGEATATLVYAQPDNDIHILEIEEKRFAWNEGPVLTYLAASGEVYTVTAVTYNFI